MDMIDQITAQDAAAKVRTFTERLNKIVSTMIESGLGEGERLPYCYVTKWHFISSRNEISIVDIDAEIDNGGEERKSIGISFLPVSIFPESWLWLDDWKTEFEKRKILTQYSIVRWRLENTEKERETYITKRLPALENSIIRFQENLKDIEERILALGLEIPK